MLELSLCHKCDSAFRPQLPIYFTLVLEVQYYKEGKESSLVL